MANLDFGKMLELQRILQDKYKDKWTPLIPENARDQLLYMIIEVGEAADVIKKQGDSRIMTDKQTREHFIEEMCDTLMYFNDVLLCYDISDEELEQVYLEKHKRNMNRW